MPRGNPQRLRNVPPPEKTRGRVFYHGTPVARWGAQVVRTRKIRPRAETSTAQGERGHTDPIPGRVYLTPSRDHAVTYALWDRPGARSSRYGYVFEIQGLSLKDVEPDEDLVGLVARASLLGCGWTPPEWAELALDELCDDSEFLTSFERFAKKHLTKTQLSGIERGIQAAESSGGKRLLRVMPERLRLRFVAAGATIAHVGAIPVSRAWKVAKHPPKASKMTSYDWKMEMETRFDELAEPVRLPNPVDLTKARLLAWT